LQCAAAAGRAVVATTTHSNCQFLIADSESDLDRRFWIVDGNALRSPIAAQECSSVENRGHS